MRKITILSLHLAEETKAFLAVQPQIPVAAEYSAETAELQAAILYLAAVVTLAQRLAAVFLAGVAALQLAGDYLVGERLLVVIPVREYLAVRSKTFCLFIMLLWTFQLVQ